MKKVRIYALPSHQTKERHSGVDMVRVNQPMKYLNGYEYGDYVFEVKVHDVNTDSDSWLDISKQYDLVFFNYTVMDWHYAAMASVVHGNKKKIVMDIDDAIWHVQSDNVIYEGLQKLNAAYILTCIIDDVDGVITTNRYLRNVITHETHKRIDQIKVIENHIDPELYTYDFEAKDTGTITLMHYGSSSHFEDLLDENFCKGIDRIMQEYPQVVLKTIQSFISKLRYRWGQRYQNAGGDVDIYKWISGKFGQYMSEADIMVVPLRDTIYNRCKSDIKFLESGSTGVPGVYSSTRPYRDTIEHGITGYLASTEQEWYESIKALVNSVDTRQKIGRAAREYVRSNRDIRQYADEYASYFLKILDLTV